MGVRAILPYVDEFRPVHSLNSLAELAEALGKNHLNDKSQMTGWIKKLNEVEIGINHEVE